MTDAVPSFPSGAVLRMSVADQALMNLMGYLALDQFVASPNYRMALDCLRELMPRVGREILIVARMAEQADKLLAAEMGSPEASGAKHGAALVLRDFLFWRAGLALDALPGWTDKGDAA